jgi:hypothetical protein
MSRLKSNGFATVESVLVVIIIVLVAVTGYAVYTTHKNANDELDKATTASQSAAPQTKKRAGGANILDIKEWGVKITLSASRGVVYEADSLDRSKPPIIFHVYSSQTDSIKGPGGISCKGEEIAGLVRMPSNDPRWSDVQFVGASADQKVIGNYRYNLANIKQVRPPCFGVGTPGSASDKTTADKFQKVVDAFALDFKSLQAE